MFFYTNLIDTILKFESLTDEKGSLSCILYLYTYRDLQKLLTPQTPTKVNLPLYITHKNLLAGKRDDSFKDCEKIFLLLCREVNRLQQSTFR